MDKHSSLPTCRTAIVDPDQLASVASETELKINRLSRGSGPSFSRQTRSLEHWGLDLTELNSRIYADGVLRPGKIAVLFVFRGGDSRICGIPLREGLLVTLPPGAAIEANIYPGLAYAGAVMDADQWRTTQSYATGMNCEPGVVELRAELTLRLKALVSQAVSQFETAATQQLSEGAFVDTFNRYSACLAEAYALGQDRYEAIDRSVRRRLRQAHQARDFICAHIGESIPIPRLCAAIGVSRRQLEYAFLSAFDVSPREFIHLRRLNEIRRALIATRGSERTVTDVALEHGINHPGRFAATYRSLFGESPAETARFRRRQ
jgi:AraC-like DNA-binding protein